MTKSPSPKEIAESKLNNSKMYSPNETENLMINKNQTTFINTSFPLYINNDLKSRSIS